MGCTQSHIKRRLFPPGVPFGLQYPTSFRDSMQTNLPSKELEGLSTFRDARDIALQFIHDDKVFASVWNSNQISPATRRCLRILIQTQTINAVMIGFYRLPDGREVKLDQTLMLQAAQRTQLYENNHQYNTARQSCTFNDPARILVVNGDCLDTVRYFKAKYPSSNPVVLNMANAYTPGGGWRNGCGAQEENLHRRTNLFQCLENSYNQLEETRNWSYPIPEFGGIYSPNVSVFRGSESQGYPFFSNGPEYVSFIAAAAYANPATKLNQNREVELSNSTQIINTKSKIDAIFKIALENGHDALVLSAFGCGAFRNPPKHIARLFYEMISEHYPHSFRYILFAIIEDHNSMHAHNLQGNIQPFAEIERAIMSAFVELLRKSNLDYAVARKPFRVGSRSDDIIFVSFVDMRIKKLQLLACLDKPESVTIWSMSLDERAFQLNARLLDITELGETMTFLSDRIHEADFTLAKAASTNSDGQYEVSQVNVTFTHPKNKQSITLQLYEHVDEGEKASFLSKILLHVHKRNEQLAAEVKTQQIRIKELSTKAPRFQSKPSGGAMNRANSGTKTVLSNGQSSTLAKVPERAQMSLINPAIKRRKAASGVSYDDEESD